MEYSVLFDFGNKIFDNKESFIIWFIDLSQAVGNSSIFALQYVG